MADSCSVPECDKPSRTRGMCNTHHMRRYRAENPEVDLKHRARRYGLDLDSLQGMIEKAGGRCECCGIEFDASSRATTWCVDHNHETDAVRGLICQNCNLAIGYISDSPDRAVALAAYLLSFANVLEAS